MIRLLQIELNKLRNFRAFWILAIMYVVGLAGTLLSIQGVFNAFLEENVPPVMSGSLRWDFYSLPDGWHYMTWIASFFNLLLPIIIIIVVSAEFSNKTARQNIISGMGRAEWMTSKIVLMVFVALVSTLVVFLCTMGMGLIYSDFSAGLKLFSKSYMIIGYFVQTLGYCMFAMLLSILIRHTGVVIGLNMIYALFLEMVIYFRFPDSWHGYFPLKAFSNMTVVPFADLTDATLPSMPIEAPFVSAFYILLFAGIGYWVLLKRDI